MPPATAVVIDAELAFECLNSVPNHQEPALRLLSSLRTYLEFHSSKDILKNPPQGYLFPNVDLDDGLDIIQQNVEDAQYQSEYAFQLDITTLLLSAKDGHLTWNGDLLGAFTFARLDVGTGLVALSSDGQQSPQVYWSGMSSALPSPSSSFTPASLLTPPR